jgi:hypothetical protein
MEHGHSECGIIGLAALTAGAADAIVLRKDDA